VLLGPSGCGKTTLLKTVNRLVEPSAGSIHLDGTDVRQVPPPELRRRIGYAIQKAGLFPHLTVAQNVAVVPKLLGWSRSRWQTRVDELLTLVQLPPGDYRDRYPAQLSGGQQQRVGIARALAGDPQVVLMDEPFGALDAITRRDLQGQLAALQRRLGKTILFVSHDIEEALQLGDRVLVMREGRIVQCDRPLALLQQPRDEFVAALVGAEDCLRQLGLVSVAEVMTPVSLAGAESRKTTLAPDSSLREAVGAMLATGDAAIAVVASGEARGVVTWEQIRSCVSLPALSD